MRKNARRRAPDPTGKTLKSAENRDLAGKGGTPSKFIYPLPLHILTYNSLVFSAY